MTGKYKKVEEFGGTIEQRHPEGETCREIGNSLVLRREVVREAVQQKHRKKRQTAADSMDEIFRSFSIFSIE